MKKIGKNISIEMTGKSHSNRIDFRLSGIKRGHKIDLEYIQNMLDRRSSKNKDYATKRKELDTPVFIKGIENGYTNGEDIVGYFENKDTKSKDYSKFKQIPRPSHVDLVNQYKNGSDVDLSGSSYFSGRMTVALVAMGAVAKNILKDKGIEILSHLKAAKNIEDKSFLDLDFRSFDSKTLDTDIPLINQDIKGQILDLAQRSIEEKDSFGGQIEAAILGLDRGIGDAYFERVQSYLAEFLLAIPGSKGLEFGNGFKATRLSGSENNDLYINGPDGIVTSTNRAGGLNGGITNGMPLILNIGFKPTSSIGKNQKTLNIESGQTEDLVIEGRHDPAFVLRAFPVVESMIALAALDIVYDHENLNLRDRIDTLDQKLVDLLLERFNITDQVGYDKLKTGKPINDPTREKEILDRFFSKYPDYSNEIQDYFKAVFFNSKKRQENIIKINKSQYGLIGRKLGYSYSKEIHELFADYIYELIELRPDQVGDFLQREDLKGLNVTIPYKKTVIPYLDKLTYEAKMIGAVNTIKFENGKKTGYNTDYYGFKKLLINKKIFVKGKKVLVLGTGATSKTIQAVLNNMGASEIIFVSRKGDVNYENVYDYQDFEVIINTTPVGTNSDDHNLLINLDKLPNIKYLADVVYNPMNTRLVVEAKKRGIQSTGGLDMLIYQAKKSIEIFTGNKILEPEAARVRDEIVNSKLNIVLVGMPGSGKTTIGRNLAKSLDKNHIDLDDEFFRVYGKRPGQVIQEIGEEEFRKLETEVVKNVGKMNNLVISTGGGVVTRPENYYHLKQNALIILIDRDITKLSTRNRPLSQGGIKTLETMLNNRKESYEEFADLKVVNNGYFRYAVENIEKIVRENLRSI